MTDDAAVLGRGGRMSWWGASLRCVRLLALMAWLAPNAAFAQGAASTDGRFPVADDPDVAAAEVAARDSGDALRQAREAFLEGRRLMAAEQWGKAAAAFRVALDAQPTPGLHYHVGVCLERSGDVLGARAAYVAAQALVAEQPAADVALLLPDALRRVEARLSRLEVVLVPESAAAWLDGARLLRPYPEWILPGRHALRAEAEGYERLDLGFEAVAGATERVEARLRPVLVPASERLPPVAEAAAAPAPLPPEEPRARPVAPRAVFWGSVAFGAVGLAAGVAGTIWHLDASARVTSAQAELEESGQASDSACYGPFETLTDPCQRLRVAVGEEESAAILLVGGFVVAGVGVAGALTSWAIWPRENFAVRGRAGFGSVQLEVRGRF